MRKSSFFIIFILFCHGLLAQDYQENVIKKFPYDSSLHYPEHYEPQIPNDVEADLDNSFPQPGSVLGSLIPEKYFKWKTDLYDKIGLKVGISYQTLYTYSSTVISEENVHDGWGGWLQFETQWKAVNKDKDWEGSLSMVIDWRHRLGGGVIPGNLFFENGSMWAIDATYLPWDPYMFLLFWEQHGTYDRIWFRVGQIASAAVLDFFRFKDSRVSFSSPAVTFPLHAVPFSAPALGLAFKWKPIEGSGMYISGAINDLNATAGEFDWSGLFDYGEVFAGLEFGKNWIRGKGDFDHAHLLLFYADKRSSSPLPTESGWGFKVHGTKQWGNLVGFANYTYNTSEGGGFGLFTIADHSVTAGLVRLNPLKVKGELGVSFQMAHPIEERANLFNNIAEIAPEAAIFPGARTESQYGLEAYWRLLLLRQLWVTPGLQFHINPTYNPNEDYIFAPVIKARVIF